MAEIYTEPMTLADLKTGETAVVQCLNCAGAGRQRLLDIGLVKNARIKCVAVAPLGDPKIYEINNFELAVRKIDAKYILVGGASK
jgi:ferrous iron transport protein A